MPKIFCSLSLRVDCTVENHLLKAVKVLPVREKGIEWTVSGDHTAAQLEPKIHQALLSYTQGKPYDLPYDFSSYPSFYKKVLTFLQTIPFGTVMSYGEVAERVGNPGAARAVGSACRCNSFLLFIPCHRILGSKKSLTGYTGGLLLKQQLLTFEQQ